MSVLYRTQSSMFFICHFAVDITGHSVFLEGRISYKLQICYSRNAVSSLASKGIIVGDPQGRFNPRGGVTRAQVATFIVKSLNLPLEDNAAPTFTDVVSHWSKPFVETAFRYGITSGTSPTTFSPDRFCSREELITMLMKAIGSNPGAMNPNVLNGILTEFKDANLISPWAKAPMALAYSENLISGYNGLVTPKNLATREQTAVILDNYLSRYALNSSLHATLSPGKVSELVKAVVVIETYDADNKPLAQGSGFHVGKGLILTNYHVLSYGSSFKVVAYDGQTYTAKGITWTDKNEDWALLSVPELPSGFGVLALEEPHTALQGDNVFAIGSPMGLQNTVSSGIISSVRGSALLQITVPTTHGNSGGPLLNRNGIAIGITTAGYGEGNLNFAISITSEMLTAISNRSSNPTVLDPVYLFKEDADKETVKINTQIRRMFDAMTEENLVELKAVLSPGSDVHAYAGIYLGPLFAIYDLIYNIDSVQVTRLSSDSSEAEVVYTIRKLQGPNYRSREMRAKIELEANGDAWTVSSLDESMLRYLDETGSSYDSGIAGPWSSDDLSHRRFLLNLEVTDAVMDPDRPVIYISEKATKKLYAVNYETRQVSAMTFSNSPESLAIADGRLYAALLKRDHYTGWINGVTHNGVIAVVNTSDFSLIRQLEIDMDPYSIAADGLGHLYISNGSGSFGVLKSYSTETGKPIGSSLWSVSRAKLELNTITDTLYYMEAGTIHSVRVSEEGQFIDLKPAKTDTNYLTGGVFDVSPDGRYVFNGNGSVFFGTLNPIRKLDRTFTDIAFDTVRNRFYAGTEENYILVYDQASFDLVGRYNIQGQAVRIFHQDSRIISIVKRNGRYYMEALELNDVP